MKIILFLIISFSFSSLGEDSSSTGWGQVGTVAVSMATSMLDSEDAQKVGVGVDGYIAVKKFMKCSLANVPACVAGALHAVSTVYGIRNVRDTRKKRREHYGGGGGPSGGSSGGDGGGLSGGSSGGDGNGNDDPRCTSEDGADDTRCEILNAQNYCEENPQDVGCRQINQLPDLCKQAGMNCDNLPKITLPNGETIDPTKTKPPKITDDEYKEALASVKASHPELFSSSGSSGGSSAEGPGVGSDDFILEEGDFEEGVSASDYYGSNGGKSGGPITIRRGLSSTDDEDDEDMNNWYAKFQQRLKNNKIDRGSLKFKPKKLGNDQIGTSHDNIFDMMSQGYK